MSRPTDDSTPRESVTPPAAATPQRVSATSQRNSDAFVTRITDTRVRVLVFDLDGTLIDSHKDIAAAVNHALSVSGRPTLDEKTITAFVGDGYQKLLQRAAGLPPNAPEIERLGTAFLTYYAAHAAVFTTPYEGVRETLHSLAQAYTLALCTNKPRVTTERVLSELDLGRYFAAVVAGDDLPQRKPDPAPLLHITRELGVEPRELAMIGDGSQDIECGRAVGALCIGVEFGMKSADAMLAAQPDNVVTRFADLLGLFVAQGE